MISNPFMRNSAAAIGYAKSFLRLRDLSLLYGANLPGEPKLATEFLKKIEELDSRIV
jgi:hypothetical protein